MGIDVMTLDFLMENRQFIRGDFLMLGRQGLHLWNENYERGRKVFNKHDPIGYYEGIFRKDGWHSDDFFKYLGCNVVESMDYSDFEQASIIHDLNKPVPAELHNKFDVIFDGGTAEHVYDVKTVMDNIKIMLKVGGIFIAVSPANNTLGHGFYQFSPELYRSVFSIENGYKIEKYQMAAITPDTYKLFDLPEPPKGHRQTLKTGMEEVSNCVIIRKLEENNTEEIQQSDYLREWGKL